MQAFDRRDELTACYLTSPVRTLFGRHDLDVDRGKFDDLRTLLPRFADRLSRTHRSDRLRNKLDMRRCRAAAPADKLCAGLDEPPGELRHVFRRAHVKLSTLDVAGQPGIRLCRQLLR